jgi:hypothetical protein
MRLHETDRHRTTAPFTDALPIRWEFVILVLLILTAAWRSAAAQQADDVPVANCAPLKTEQVVHNLDQMNLYRAQALYAYHGTRTYRAEYRGFPGTRSAEMVVNVKYLSPATKEFTIQSSTGSKLIIDKVFKKLLEAEKEALGAESQRRSALNNDNYRFTLIGCESGSSGATYVLKVEPRKKDKFLYRGLIWVDAEDFAVVRVEAEPAKTPSFWSKKAEIVQVYMKVGDFWLPAYNHSVTAIRLGGHAEMTINYKDYQITGASRVSSLSMLRTTPHAESARAQE